jgi:hypothetical protein
VPHPVGIADGIGRPVAVSSTAKKAHYEQEGE